MLTSAIDVKLIPYLTLPKSWDFNKSQFSADLVPITERIALRSSHLFYNLLTKTALLIYNETAYPLDGHFDSREEAEKAAEAVIAGLKSTPPGPDDGLLQKFPD